MGHDFKGENLHLLGDREFCNRVKELNQKKAFVGADLRGLNFRNRTLENINFTGALLHGANFNEANISGANFQETKSGITLPTAIVISALILPLSLTSGIVVSYSITWLFYSVKYIDETNLDLLNTSIIIFSIVVLSLTVLFTLSSGLREYLALSVIGFISINFILAAFLTDDAAAFSIIGIASTLGCFSALLIQAGVIFLAFDLENSAFNHRGYRRCLSYMYCIGHAALNTYGLYIGAEQAKASPVWGSIVAGIICLLTSYVLGIRSFVFLRKKLHPRDKRLKLNPYVVISSTCHSILKPFFFTRFVEAYADGKTDFTGANRLYANFSDFKVNIEYKSRNKSRNPEGEGLLVNITINGDSYGNIDIGDLLGMGAIKTGDMEGSAVTQGNDNEIETNTTKG